MHSASPKRHRGFAPRSMACVSQLGSEFVSNRRSSRLLGVDYFVLGVDIFLYAIRCLHAALIYRRRKTPQRCDQAHAGKFATPFVCLTGSCDEVKVIFFFTCRPQITR